MGSDPDRRPSTDRRAGRESERTGGTGRRGVGEISELTGADIPACRFMTRDGDVVTRHDDTQGMLLRLLLATALPRGCVHPSVHP